MGKKLSEMSLEELWQLFPIILTRHQDCWKKWYLEEETLLKKNLLQVERISHIGSTAIPTIWAKPIIDILVGKRVGLELYQDHHHCGGRCFDCITLCYAQHTFYPCGNRSRIGCDCDGSRRYADGCQAIQGEGTGYRCSPSRRCF